MYPPAWRLIQLLTTDWKIDNQIIPIIVEENGYLAARVIPQEFSRDENCNHNSDQLCKESKSDQFISQHLISSQFNQRIKICLTSRTKQVTEINL